MQDSPIKLPEGITYSKQEIKQYRENFFKTGAGWLGMEKCVISEIKEVKQGILTCELSYPNDISLSLRDYQVTIDQLFKSKHAPDFWEIKLVHLIEYHTTGPGGYYGLCGNVIYDSDYYDPEEDPDYPGFNRYYMNDHIFDTSDIYHILYETELRWGSE